MTYDNHCFIWIVCHIFLRSSGIARLPLIRVLGTQGAGSVEGDGRQLSECVTGSACLSPGLAESGMAEVRALISNQEGRWWRRDLSQEEGTRAWCQGEWEPWRCVDGQMGGLRGLLRESHTEMDMTAGQWRGHRSTVPSPKCLGPEAIQVSEAFRFQIGYVLHVSCNVTIKNLNISAEKYMTISTKRDN